MSIEDIIRAWKADENTLDSNLPANPVGRELDEQELEEVSGSFKPICSQGGPGPFHGTLPGCNYSSPGF